MGAVELIEGEFYWVVEAYADKGWIVARREHGVFWGPNGHEVTPRFIRGPIERPMPPPKLPGAK